MAHRKRSLSPTRGKSVLHRCENRPSKYANSFSNTVYKTEFLAWKSPWTKTESYPNISCRISTNGRWNVSKTNRHSPKRPTTFFSSCGKSFAGQKAGVFGTKPFKILGIPKDHRLYQHVLLERG